MFLPTVHVTSPLTCWLSLVSVHCPGFLVPVRNDVVIRLIKRALGEHKTNNAWSSVKSGCLICMLCARLSGHYSVKQQVALES